MTTMDEVIQAALESVTGARIDNPQDSDRLLRETTGSSTVTRNTLKVLEKKLQVVVGGYADNDKTPAAEAARDAFFTITQTIAVNGGKEIERKERETAKLALKHLYPDAKMDTPEQLSAVVKQFQSAHITNYPFEDLPVLATGNLNSRTAELINWTAQEAKYDHKMAHALHDVAKAFPHGVSIDHFDHTKAAKSQNPITHGPADTKTVTVDDLFDHGAKLTTPSAISSKVGKEH